MLREPSTWPDSDFASVLTSTDCSNPEVFVHVALSTENSVGEFSMVPNNRVVITILTCKLNFDSTRFRYCKGCAYHFLFHASIL